jgi:hypothetical protein
VQGLLEQQPSAHLLYSLTHQTLCVFLYFCTRTGHAHANGSFSAKRHAHGGESKRDRDDTRRRTQLVLRKRQRRSAALGPHGVFSVPRHLRSPPRHSLSLSVPRHSPSRPLALNCPTPPPHNARSSATSLRFTLLLRAQGSAHTQ